MVTAGTSSASVGSKADLPSAPGAGILSPSSRSPGADAVDRRVFLARGDGEDEVGKQLRLAMKAAAVQYGRALSLRTPMRHNMAMVQN